MFSASGDDGTKRGGDEISRRGDNNEKVDYNYNSQIQKEFSSPIKGSSIINIKTNDDAHKPSLHIYTEENMDLQEEEKRDQIKHGEEVNNTKIQEVLGPYIDQERAQFKQNSNNDFVVFSNNLKNTMDTKYMNYCKLIKKDKDTSAKQITRFRSGSKTKLRKK